MRNKQSTGTETETEEEKGFFDRQVHFEPLNRFGPPPPPTHTIGVLTYELWCCCCNCTPSRLRASGFRKRGGGWRFLHYLTMYILLPPVLLYQTGCGFSSHIRLGASAGVEGGGGGGGDGDDDWHRYGSDGGATVDDFRRRVCWSMTLPG